MKQSITATRLRELLSYDPATGLFTWLKRTGPGHTKAIGSVAGVNRRGYRFIGIDSVKHPAHRLAWLYVHGTFPSGVIDHINGDTCDNRIENLRDVTPTVNRQNIRKPAKHNKTGFLGVRPVGDKFRAFIDVRGKRVALGTFAQPELAHAAYLNAKRQHHAGCSI